MRTTFKGATVIGAACVMAASAAMTASATQVGHAGTTTPRWRVVFRAKLAQANVITDLATASSREAWAIGIMIQPTGGRYGYAVHWDGRSWRMVGLPRWFDPVAVSASAPANIWVGGLQHNPTNPPASTTATLRWAGTGWQRIPPPPIYGGVGGLAVGAADAWTVSAGAWTRARGWQHVSAFWDGGSWTKRPFPTLGPYPVITASPGGGVWAFGTSSRALAPKVGRVIAFRWIGHGIGWRQLRLPRLESGEGAVAVSVGSATSMWLETLRPRLDRNGTFHEVFWHWNGKTLTRLPSPGLIVAGPQIAADGRGGAWFGPLAHWTHGRWVSPARPDRCRFPGLTLAVSTIPGTRSAWGALDCPGREGEIEVTGPLP